MKEYIVQICVTKEYLFTTVAKSMKDAWQNAEAEFDANDAEEISSKFEVVWAGEKKDD